MIVRTIDSSNRIIIPKVLRQSVGWDNNVDYRIEISEDSNGEKFIKITPVKPIQQRGEVV